VTLHPTTARTTTADLLRPLREPTGDKHLLLYPVHPTVGKSISSIFLKAYAANAIVYWTLWVVSVPLSAYGGVVAHSLNGYLGIASLSPITGIPAVVALHVDRQYVARHSDWTPSRVYYLLGIPTVVTMVVTVVYVYRRATKAPRRGAA